MYWGVWITLFAVFFMLLFSDYYYKEYYVKPRLLKQEDLKVINDETSKTLNGSQNGKKSN